MFLQLAKEDKLKLYIMGSFIIMYFIAIYYLNKNFVRNTNNKSNKK